MLQFATGPRRRLALLFGAALLLVALNACCKNCPPQGVVLAPTTEVLDDETAAALVSTSDGELRFDGETAQLAALEVGDVVAASVGDRTPQGLLRRVDVILADGGQVVLQTSPARLQDAIVRGAFSYAVTLTADDLAAGLPPGMTMRTQQGGGLVVAFNDVPLNDAETVRMSGSLSIAPTLELEVEISASSIVALDFTLNADQDAGLQVVADDGATLDEEVVIGSPWIFPSTVVQVGPFPVVLTPVVTFRAAATGETAADLSSSVVQNADYALKLTFDGDVDVDPTGSFEAQSDPLIVNGFASARLQVGPKFQLLLNGEPGPFANVDAYLEAEASFGSSPPCLLWELIGGLDADIGVETVLDYEATVLDVRRKIADSNGCTGVTPSTTWSNTLVGEHEGVQSIQPLAAGGFVLLGYETVWANISPLGSWVMRLDAAGNIVWQRAYDGIGYPGAVREIAGGDLLVVSGGVPGTNSDRVVLSRLDPDGGLRWSKEVRSEDGRGLHADAVQLWDDGSFVLAGTIIGASLASRDVWAAAFDPQGEPLWSRTYGGPAADIASDLLIAEDGSIVIAASTETELFSPIGSEDYWAFALDGSGDIAWQRAYGGTFRDLAASIATFGEGGYLLVGHSESFENPNSTEYDGGDVLVLELGGGGVLASATSFDTSDSDVLSGDWAADVVETRDGGYAFSGWSARNLWLRKVGGDGAWSKFYVGPDRGLGRGHLTTFRDYPDQLLEVAEGGLVVATSSDAFSDDFDPEAWLLQVTETGAIDFNDASGAFVENPDGSFYAPDVLSGATSVVPVDAPLVVTAITSDVDVTGTAATVNRLAP